MPVLRTDRRPVVHAFGQPRADGGVAVGDLGGLVADGFGQRLLLEEPVAEVHNQKRRNLQRLPQPQKLVQAEAVRQSAPAVTDRDGPPRALAAGHMVDHVEPVDVVHVGAAGEADDGNLHLAQFLDHTRLEPVRPRHEGPFRTRFAPTGALHEMAEQTGINPVEGRAADGKAYLVGVGAAGRRHAEQAGKTKARDMKMTGAKSSHRAFPTRGATAQPP